MIYKGLVNIFSLTPCEFWIFPSSPHNFPLCKMNNTFFSTVRLFQKMWDVHRNRNIIYTVRLTLRTQHIQNYWVTPAYTFRSHEGTVCINTQNLLLELCQDLCIYKIPQQMIFVWWHIWSNKSVTRELKTFEYFLEPFWRVRRNHSHFQQCWFRI